MPSTKTPPKRRGRRLPGRIAHTPGPSASVASEALHYAKVFAVNLAIFAIVSAFWYALAAIAELLGLDAGFDGWFAVYLTVLLAAGNTYGSYRDDMRV
jgi:hypothetical protein